MADDAAATADLLAARAASACRDWQQARAGFLALRSRGPLAASDIEALAEAAWWEGAIDESLSAWEEAYRPYLLGASYDVIYLLPSALPQRWSRPVGATGHAWVRASLTP